MPCAGGCGRLQGRGFGLVAPLHIMLKREGLVVNHKRTERPY